MRITRYRTNTNRRSPIAGISQDLLDRFELFRQYSTASGCANNTVWDTPNTKIKCTSGCPLVEAAGATVIRGGQYALFSPSFPCLPIAYTRPPTLFHPLSPSLRSPQQTTNHPSQPTALPLATSPPTSPSTQPTNSSSSPSAEPPQAATTSSTPSSPSSPPTSVRAASSTKVSTPPGSS